MTPAARLRAMAEKATGAPWQVRCRLVEGVTHFEVKEHTHGSVVYDVAYWGGRRVPTVDQDGYFVRDDGCDVPDNKAASAELIVHLRNRAHLYADLIEAAAAYRDSVSVNVDKTGRLDAQASYAALRRVEAALDAIDAADKEGV